VQNNIKGQKQYGNGGRCVLQKAKDGEWVGGREGENKWKADFSCMLYFFYLRAKFSFKSANMVYPNALLIESL
jgi:hypothetical protein